MQQEAFYGQIVGQVIRGRRELQGITLATMSQSLALASPSGWSRVETGDTAMTVTQLRKAARKLGVKPSQIVQQADLLVEQLEANGVVVGDEKPKDIGKWVLGGAGILALIAGAGAAAAVASKAKVQRTSSSADDDPDQSKDEDEEKEPS